MVDTQCPVIEITSRSATNTGTGTIMSTDTTEPIAGVLTAAFIIQLIMLIIVIAILYYLLKYAKII